MDDINDEIDLGLDGDDELDPLAEDDEEEEKLPGADGGLEVDSDEV